MNAVTHTPGPWGIDAAGVKAGDPDGFQPFGSCGCCGSPWMSSESEDQQLADARLIAAAPELLEAAQTVAAFLSNGINAETANGLVAARIRTAIAKATGAA